MPKSEINIIIHLSVKAKSWNFSIICIYDLSPTVPAVWIKQLINVFFQYFTPGYLETLIHSALTHVKQASKRCRPQWPVMFPNGLLSSLSLSLSPLANTGVYLFLCTWHIKRQREEHDLSKTNRNRDGFCIKAKANRRSHWNQFRTRR